MQIRFDDRDVRQTITGRSSSQEDRLLLAAVIRALHVASESDDPATADPAATALRRLLRAFDLEGAA